MFHSLLKFFFPYQKTAALSTCQYLLTFLFAYDFLSPHGVTQVSFHLTFGSQEPCFLLREVCVVLLDWEPSSISASYQFASFWRPPWFWREHCKGLKGLSFWPQISGESELASSKGGLLTVIYSPHRDKVRHGHCLCTWAFIKRPGWALCRRHSNVQGAD